MLERRLIRVLAPYSRTLYYNEKGRERGIAAELVRDFEQWLNKKYAKKLGKRPLTVYVSPTTRDELIDDVAEGLGDIAAGNLSVTTERLKKLDFVAPERSRGDEGGPRHRARPRRRSACSTTSPARRCTCGRRRAITRASWRSTRSFKAAGRRLVHIVALPDALEDEDMMEMINAGILADLRGRRVEGQDLGADPAEAQAARRPGAA